MVATVLVVDDDADVCALLCDDLAFAGFRVLSAASGNKALALVDSEQVDLVLSDVRMPDGDGLYLAARLQERQQAPTVVLITGFRGLSPEYTAPLGVHAVLSKPYELADLVRTVRDALAGVPRTPR